MAINLLTGSCYRMNATGADLWESLQAGKTIEESVTALAQRYGVAPSTAESDVLRLCAELISYDLARVQGVDGSS